MIVDRYDIAVLRKIVDAAEAARVPADDVAAARAALVRVEKPKTPGEVAYGMYLQVMEMFGSWDHLNRKERAAWNAAAGAVIDHHDRGQIK